MIIVFSCVLYTIIFGRSCSRNGGTIPYDRSSSPSKAALRHFSLGRFLTLRLQRGTLRTMLRDISSARTLATVTMRRRAVLVRPTRAVANGHMSLSEITSRSDLIRYTQREVRCTILRAFREDLLLACAQVGLRPSYFLRPDAGQAQCQIKNT
jgi:hypothetical protein